MSTNRELLELSARAAGIEGHYTMNDWGFGGIVAPVINGGDCPWNPLTDDGDALRVAVKLRIDICWASDMVYTQTTIAPTPMFKEEEGTDPYAATRRAIVKAAAEIGKGVPQRIVGDVPVDEER